MQRNQPKTDKCQGQQYKFWIEVDGKVVEWVNLSKDFAVRMYKATLINNRSNVTEFGWEVQE